MKIVFNQDSVVVDAADMASAKAMVLEKYPQVKFRIRNVFGARCLGAYDPTLPSFRADRYKAFIVIRRAEER